MATPPVHKLEQRGEVLEILQVLLSEGRLEEVQGLVEQLLSRNNELELRLAKLLLRPRKNEGVSTAQLKLALDALTPSGDAQRDQVDADLRKVSGIDDDTDAPVAPAPKRQPPVRKPPPSHLRRVDNPLRVPQSDRACPKCGDARECIGHDVTEVIELVPAEVIVRLDKREKLACRTCEGQLARGPRGDKVVSGGRMGPMLVATLLTEKYRDGLPLHRQRERLQRLGLPVSVSTLADQVKWATQLLEPLWRLALEQCLTSKVMHIDGTGLPVLDRDHPTGKRTGSLWGFVGDEVACITYASTGKKKGQRDGELGPEDILARRRGYTVADASSLFDRSFKRPELIECGCNMHARRYFVKALDGGDNRASLPVSAFKVLYELEDEYAELDAAERTEARQGQSKVVYDHLVNWCETHQPFEPPKSPLGAAIQYLLNHQLALRRFLDDGDIPLDNGAVERLHVRTALTRKNFLFAGSDAGAERAAIAYTILGCCALVDVNPIEYLAGVLPVLAGRVRRRDLGELMPAAWKARQLVATPEAAT